MTSPIQESLFIERPGYRLHLRRIYCDPQGPPVFMLHGAVENGRIFYSESGRGLGPYLAAQGFDVYIADLRGRGKSTPAIDRTSTYGQTETITEEIPAFIEAIRERRGDVPQHWIGHSWGGVLLNAYLARFSTHRQLVKSMVFFGSKRTVRGFNREKLIKIILFWSMAAPLLTRICGYLPARQLKAGPDNETVKSHAHSMRWVKSTAWIDPDDGFDYGAAIHSIELPPVLYLAGLADYALGHPDDVRRFMDESGPNRARFELLSRCTGYHHDYNHINMLTHPHAPKDHFPLVVEWLRNAGQD